MQTDTGVLTMTHFRHYTPLRAPDYEEFLRSTPRFLLCTRKADWMGKELVKAGFKVQPLGAVPADRNTFVLYEVSRME